MQGAATRARILVNNTLQPIQIMFYSVTCKNANCGKRFKIRGPLQAGVHKVGCPFCSKKMSVRISGDASAAPAPKKAAAQAPNLDQIRKQYEPALASLQADYTKKQTALKETYERKRTALKAAFDSQRAANEAEFVKAKAAIEAEMQAAIAEARQAAALQQKRQAQEQKTKTAVKPKAKDFSAAPKKDLGTKIETGKDNIKATCPHCGQEIGLPKQEKAGAKEMRCPKCKGAIGVTYIMPHIPTFNWSDMTGAGPMLPNPQKPVAQKPQAPKPVVPQPNPVISTLPKREKPYLIANHKDTGRQLRFSPDENGRPLGSPVQQGNGRSTEKAYLNPGSNTIGRYDPLTPSDISIDGRYDSRMSRCSTSIEVTLTPQGYKFAIVLRNSKNPVMCNGLVMVANKPYPITYGSDIIMGETRFKLMCEM